VSADGLQTVNSSTEWTWSDLNAVTGDGWMEGGEWKPAHCVARYRIWLL